MNSIAIKTAQTQGPVSQLIRKRWSARSFSSQPIGQSDMETLFEAASWAPSSMNDQPWKYLWALREESRAHEQMVKCLLPSNQAWAKDAAALVLSLAETNFSQNGKANRHYLHDVGSANTLLLLQATEMNIYGHMIGGFDMALTKEIFQIPDRLEPVCFIALGYLAEPEQLEEPFRSRELSPRSRKPLSTFAFQNQL